MNRIRKTLTILTLCLLVTGMAMAHGGEKHGSKTVMGFVQSVENGQVEFKTKDGKDMTFSLAKDTTIMNGKSAGKVSDLKEGSRAMIKYDPSTKPFTAHEIMLAGGSTGSNSHGDHDHGGHDH